MTEQTPKQPTARAIDAAKAQALAPRRSADAHKWSVGGLIIIAGSPVYIGAATLAAMAAGRAGAGITTLVTPRSAMSAVAAVVPEVVFLPVPDGDPADSTRRVVGEIRKRLEKARALVVGPGLGDDEHSTALLAALFGSTKARRDFGFGVSSGADASSADPIFSPEHPSVIDADGLNWLATREDWWQPIAAHSLVLTPHVGEMARLTGGSTDEVLADPQECASSFAARTGQVVVLKGNPTVVSDGEETFVAPASPRCLATAGSGDVLSGTIGAFLAQGLSPIDAAQLGCYVGSLAGQALEERIGVLGVVASDLPMEIAEQLHLLEQGKGSHRA